MGRWMPNSRVIWVFMFRVSVWKGDGAMLHQNGIAAAVGLDCGPEP